MPARPDEHRDISYVYHFTIVQLANARLSSSGLIDPT